ncbi:MAG: amino acid synthesis family protein, partial [Alphaproteobacteria bacterium]
MAVEIRRTLLQIQDTFIEGGKVIDTPTKLVAALAVIRNPWFGRGYVEDLQPEIREHGPVLGKLLTQMLLDTVGDTLEGC